MTRSEKIKKLIKKISKDKPREEDIKALASVVIEVMAETGIPPETRKRFITEAKRPSPDIETLISSTKETIGLMNERPRQNN